MIKRSAKWMAICLAVMLIVTAFAGCGSKNPSDSQAVSSASGSDVSQVGDESDANSGTGDVSETGAAGDSTAVGETTTTVSGQVGGTTKNGQTGSGSATTKAGATTKASTATTKPVAAAFRSYQERLQSFHKPDGRLMVCAHRADHVNHPENSIAGIKSAIAMGVDILELDVQQTKDGKFVLMHDSTLTRTTNAVAKKPSGVVSFEVKDWTLQQIKTLNLKGGLGGATAALTDEKVPSLEEMIEACRGKVLVNLDKAWVYKETIYPVLKSKNALEFCMLKSSNTSSTVNVFLEAKEKSDGVRPMYVMMATGTVTDSIKKVRSFTLNQTKYPVMVEMAFGTGASFEYGYDASLLKEINGKMGLWANTLTAERDTMAEWKKLKEAGYNVIQTDNPKDLCAYVTSLNK